MTTETTIQSVVRITGANAEQCNDRLEAILERIEDLLGERPEIFKEEKYENRL